ncbi:MAG: peptidoglycan-associated lipoprotein Pal [Gammaproteobacteria bacterium]|nr:peptidoglycan-associated lipoprotein Pal [Gammaproteobacteria bacterium]
MRKLTYLIVFLAGLAVAGCGGRKAAVDESNIEVEVVEGVAGAGEDASTTGLGDDPGTDAQNLGQSASASSGDGDDSDLLNQRVVYFAYDSSLLSTEAEAVVEAHARYLQSAPDVQIILEGHADERGTREYNLALAEDRTQSVANLMQALGVGAERIQTISYGEERPVALGHDESAWSLNRRVEFLY